MKFTFKRRDATFGVFNNRRENEGTEKQKVKAIDLPVRCQITLKELDMLVPCQGIPLSHVLYGEPPEGKRAAKDWKPALQVMVLSPIKVHRRPEHIELTIYDDITDKRRSMTFTDVKIKDPMVELEESGIMYLSFKAQLHPGKHFARIDENVEAQIRQFECRATQPELFDTPEEPQETTQEEPPQLPLGESGDGAEATQH